MVGYSEFVLISLWRSEQAVTRYEASIDEDSEATRAIIRRSPAEKYNVLTLEFRKPTLSRDSRPHGDENGGQD
jgi:heme-degrading monooxygenase HmoA